VPYVLIVGLVCVDSYSVVHETLGNVGCGCVVGEDGVVKAGSGVVGPEVEIIELLFCGILDAGSKAVERPVGMRDGEGVVSGVVVVAWGAAIVDAARARKVIRLEKCIWTMGLGSE